MSVFGALVRKSLHVMVNTGRIVQRDSRFKVGFIFLFAMAILWGLFRTFLSAFNFLGTMGGVGFMITRHLFSLFFLAMGLMLVISSLLTTYSTLFRSRETPYLITGPFPLPTLVIYKFFESCALSSWAFFFIIIPYAAAYAWHEQFPILFSAWTILFAIPYLMLCAGVGSILVLVVVRWWPRRRWVWMSAIIGAVIVMLVLMIHPRARGSMDETSFVLMRLVPGLQLASSPLGPNWWVAEGIMSLTHGQLGRGLMLWGVLLSHTLLVIYVVQAVGAATFYTSYQRLLGTERRRKRRERLLSGLTRLLSFLGTASRGMIIKDCRIFLRDPMQWSQVLIFFGLLGLYFASLRSFRYHILPDVWRNITVFLNVFSVSSVLCSLSARFVFPQLSLEGHGFWILGLSPVSLRRILLTKFLLALTGMLVVSAGLMSLSTWMLNVDPQVKVITLGLAVAISLATSGLSTGLGAVFLDLKQSNPVAIISGFGGTMNLALSLGFVFAVILPFAGLFHFHLTDRIPTELLNRGLTWTGLAVFALTLLATFIPLYAGYRSLVRREY